MKIIILYILSYVLFAVQGFIMFSMDIDADIVEWTIIIIPLIIFGLLSYIFFLSDVMSKKWRIIINSLFVFYLIVILVLIFLDHIVDGHRKLIFMLFVFYHVRGVLNRNKYIRTYKIILSIPLIIFLFNDYTYSSPSHASYFNFVFWWTVRIDFIIYVVSVILKKRKNKIKKRDEKQDEIAES